MPIVKTEAFVLKSLKYGETSKIVTLFTKDFGKMSALVKGARNYKSRLCGVLETMNYVNTIIYKKDNRDLQLLTSAEYILSFKNIMTDFQKLQIAFRIIEMVNKSIIFSEKNKLIFDLLLQTFSRLDNSVKNPVYVILGFQIEFLKILGISPYYFSESENKIYFNEIINLNERQINFLELFEKKQLNECDINDDTDKIRLSEVFEKFLLEHTQSSSYYLSKKIFKELNQFN
jgi:DNA repair protein RecO (recombination protein O)